MRRDTFAHHDIGARIAQRHRPSSRVVEKERLQSAGDKVNTRNSARHHAGRLVTCSRRTGQDIAEDVWMPKPQGERKLATRRDTEHIGTVWRKRDSESEIETGSTSGKP